MCLLRGKLNLVPGIFIWDGSLTTEFQKPHTRGLCVGSTHIILMPGVTKVLQGTFLLVVQLLALGLASGIPSTGAAKGYHSQSAPRLFRVEGGGREGQNWAERGLRRGRIRPLRGAERMEESAAES